MKRSRKSQMLGVTLMELMIVVAITGILIMSIGPTARDVVIRNGIIAEVNELSAAAQFARHTAINDQVTTIFCPTTNFTSCSADWNDPKMVFADLDANGQRSNDEEIIAGTGNISESHVLTGPAAAISFQASGVVATTGTLLLCHKDGDAIYARALTISLQGRVKLSNDTNSDGIHEDNTGTPLVCS